MLKKIGLGLLGLFLASAVGGSAMAHEGAPCADGRVAAPVVYSAPVAYTPIAYRGARVERRGERVERRGERMERRGERMERRGERFERGGRR